MNDMILDLSAARYDGEPCINGDFGDDLARTAYRAVASCLSDQIAVREFEHCLLLEDQKLTISCTIQRISDTNGRFVAEMLFILTHDLFDEPLCEYSSGMGHTASEAVINSAEQFCAVVLSSVLNVIIGGDVVDFEYEFAGMERHLSCVRNAATYSIGSFDHQQLDMFSLVKDELRDYLGTKNAYWLKLFCVCYNGEIECEARLNGATLHELTKKLTAYARMWDMRSGYHSEKQFLLLVDKKSEKRGAFIRPENVIIMTKRAVDILGRGRDKRSHDDAMIRLGLLCQGTKILSSELRAMIPELYTCILLDLKQGDRLRLMLGDAEIELKRTQLRIFGYVEQGVRRYLSENDPPRDFSLNILAMSSLFEAVNGAVNDGAKLENIFVNELKFRYPPEYELI